MSTISEPQPDEEPTANADNVTRGGDQPEENARSTVFPVGRTYHPVFFLTEAPGDYYQEMFEAGHYPAWIEITSNSLTNVIDEIAAKVLVALPAGSIYTPFAGSTVDQVYDFFKNHLRPADDDPHGYFHAFTYFTFLVIDAECLESDPWQCILCSDAPDYGEGHEEVKVKQCRMPIARAMEGLPLLETLVQTPSEFASNAAWVLGMIPPCWDVEIHNEWGERTGDRELAPPGRARKKKRQSIANVEETARQQQAEAESAERGEL